MIKAITFDLDGVYFTPESFVRFKSVLVSKYGCQEDRVEEALHRSEEIVLFKQGKMTEEDFWAYFNQYTGGNVTVDEVVGLFQEVYEMDSQVQNAVLNAKNAGYSTCVVSNNFITRTKALQQKFNFENDFDVVVYSYQVGVLKPAKEIFQVLANKLSLEPKEIIYSDDTESKLQGAKDLKMACFVYKNFDQFMSTLNAYGVTI